MSSYRFGPFANRPVTNQFSTNTNKISGLIGYNNFTYNFLKSSPYSESGAGGNTKDPIQRKIFESRSINFKNKVGKVAQELEKTKRQVRYNEFTRSGTSVPRPSAFDGRTDFFRLAQKSNTFNMINVIIVVVIIYTLFMK